MYGEGGRRGVVFWGFGTSLGGVRERRWWVVEWFFGFGWVGMFFGGCSHFYSFGR